MGDVLDVILKRIVFHGPETVNADFVSDAIDLDDREDEFTVSYSWNNGSSVDVSVSLEVSNDQVSWFTLTDSTRAITDDTAAVLYDIAGTGVSFMRVKIVVNAGSFDLQNIIYNGKRRH